MQRVLFEDGSDTPLFTLTPVPVIERESTRRVVSPNQILLLEPACRTCLDGGEIRMGKHVRFCWCQAGQELRHQRGQPK
jgi:hypothetical protein